MMQHDFGAHFVETDAHLTGSVAVFVDHTGERSMVSGHGADFYLLPSELPRQAITGARHLHLTAWSFFVDPPRAAARAAARLAHDSGATLSFDPGSFQMIGEMGVRQFLAVTQDLGIDVLLPNKEEGSMLTGGLTEPEEIAPALAELYPGALIINKRFANIPAGAPIFMYNWAEDNIIRERVFVPKDKQINAELHPNTLPGKPGDAGPVTAN